MSGTPESLGEHGAKLYRDITEEYDLGPHELEVLITACWELDFLRRIEDEVSRMTNLETLGSQGQIVAHPLVQEARQHALVFASLLSRLKITDEDENPAPGPMSRTRVAQLGGKARWAGKR